MPHNGSDFYLSKIHSKDDLRNLFIERWNWEFPRIKEFYPEFPEEVANKVKNSEIIAEKLQHKIILFELTNLRNPEKELKSTERKTLSSSDVKGIIDYSVFIFTTENYDYIDFVKAEKLGPKIQIKRFSITPETRNKLRTPSEQLENLNILNKYDSFSSIQNCIKDAFSVEVVTKKFYEGYINLFKKLKRTLIRQEIVVENKDKKLTEFTHQILNRIMFLYFIQKRGCFGGNKNFMAAFWDTYKERFKGKNRFHIGWLNTLFFEALSNPPWLYKEKKYLEAFNEVLKKAPYLNGGLFERNDLDNIGWVIPDDLFDDIFEFFESFNFTVEESTPLDIDIAINPEMLGNIYEHLINIEERPEQQKAGIFYTPKAEIELMIRRSLVEFLYGKTQIKKEKIYRFVFEEEINTSDLFGMDEANEILRELDEIFILDPACGSGHYLVVAVQILYSLKEKLWRYLGKEHLGKYEEKKRIIERNIYGNDIKEWAVEIAKLRLWLELFVDAEEERLKKHSESILPSFKFKIRVGDSLIQRIGNELAPIRKVKSIIQHRRDELKYLVKKKRYVYESGSAKEYNEAINWEKKILQNALTEMETMLSQKLHNLKVRQQKLGREWATEGVYFEKQHKEIVQIENELKEIKRFKNELGRLKEPPMMWDLAFAEVFAKKNGFDIVIANPPYVRHEKIEDFTGFYPKKEYKDKLIEQTIKDWSYDYEGKLRFRPGSSNHPITGSFPKKSDLYVYFYLKGLKLLNPDGVLCFISSNSWLDVGFGAKLQEILLKNVPIIAIYDSIKRSFKHADINTIIALMKAPKMKAQKKEVENNKVKFVMFKKAYEELMNAKTFIDIEKDNDLILLIEGEKRETDIYKLHVATQKELIEYGKNEEDRYDGNKWGGKYLRAPEIYWKILSKSINKLVPINTFCKYRYGVKPGSVNFFYLTKEKIEKYEIPEKYTYPILTSTQNLNKYYVTIDDCEKLFYCHKSLKKITEKGVYDYIKSGEKEKINKKPSVRNHHPFWYSININTPDIIILQFFDKRYWSPFCKDQITCSNNFCYGQFVVNKHIGIVLLNSILYFLQIEMFGRVNMAQGVLTIYKDDLKFILLPDPRLLDTQKCEETIIEISKRNVVPIFEELGLDPSKPIREQEPNPLPDRKALDDIVFDALGLTEEERKEVYWAVAELAKQRLEKARSV